MAAGPYGLQLVSVTASVTSNRNGTARTSTNTDPVSDSAPTGNTPKEKKKSKKKNKSKSGDSSVVQTRAAYKSDETFIALKKEVDELSNQLASARGNSAEESEINQLISLRKEAVERMNLRKQWVRAHESATNTAAKSAYAD